MSGPGSQAVAAATVHTPEGPVGPAVVEVEGDRITAVRSGGRAPPAVTVVPGFVDLQVNGMDDLDVSVADGTDWERLDQLTAATGVTAWLPTLVSRPLDRYAAPLERIAAAGRRAGPRPVVLGAHLEGPFLGDRPGAHPPELLVDPDPGWIDALPDVVRLVTLSPERAGALAAVETLVRRGVVVSLGHSGAELTLARAAVDAGATMVTHLFNAMGPLHHRAPGIAGAALADDRVTAGLVADLVHVHPALVTTAFRTKGPEHLALVTDAVAWRSGRAADRDVRLRDGAPRLADGTIAGSALTMDQAVRNVVDRAGVSVAAAVRAASTTPADVLGDPTRGRVAVGARADLVVLDDDDLTVRRTLVGGHTVWEA